jgi:hypothetical protein
MKGDVVHGPRMPRETLPDCATRDVEQHDRAILADRCQQPTIRTHCDALKYSPRPLVNLLWSAAHSVE